MIHILIPIYNRIEHTRSCLNSLINQRRDDIHIVVVDDGSTDGSVEYIRNEFGKRLRITLLEGTGELFWGGAIEMAMRHVMKHGGESDYFMTLNNDAKLPRNYLNTAFRLAEKYPDSLLGGVSVDSEGCVAVSGWRMHCWPLALTQRVWWPMSGQELDAESSEVIDIDFLPGTATLAPLSLIRRIGPVKGTLLPHYHADTEFSWRSKKSGSRVLLGRDLRISHDLTSTGTTAGFRRISLLIFFRSFFSIRSGNCLRYKFRFARLCCPGKWLVFFLFADTLKVFTKGILTCISGNSAQQLKQLINRVGS